VQQAIQSGAYPFPFAKELSEKSEKDSFLDKSQKS
jgi:hypothetical protein